MLKDKDNLVVLILLEFVQVLNLTKNEGKVIKSKDNLEDRKKALAKRMSNLPKKKPDSVKALGIIKKDVNIKGKGKSFKDYNSIAAAKRAGSLYYMGKDGKKKAAVTKADLDKSGLSLRDYINFKLNKSRKGK